MNEIASDLLIMDLEGTDALERKANRGNFERQTSLMALTLSEVLIINMWAQDIGRAAGMNVDTLKSIIQANLRLFAPNSKTRLLFLIREQNPDDTAMGTTPAAVLFSFHFILFHFICILFLILFFNSQQLVCKDNCIAQTTFCVRPVITLW